MQAVGFSLQGRQHEDRDAQFRYLNRCVGEHVAAGQPVISVDTKKKELVGEFKNGGREYQPRGTSVPTNVHDSMTKELGKAIRYGIFDVIANTGRVCRWAPTTTPLLLPCRPYAAGGTPSDAAATRTPTGCLSAPTAAAPTATGSARLEDRAGPARRRNRARDHRLPSAPGQ